MAQPAEPMQSDVLAHTGPWTERDYFALPEDNRRIELVDGGVFVSPSPGGPHQRLSSQVWLALARATPAELEVLQAINVRVAPGKILIPDLAVVTNPGAALTVWSAADVALVVEIVSPGSTAADRAIKPTLYARAGIPRYLRIELGAPAPTAVVYQLTGERYTQAGQSDARGQLRLDAPVPVDLDLATLARTTRLSR